MKIRKQIEELLEDLLRQREMKEKEISETIWNYRQKNGEKRKKIR